VPVCAETVTVHLTNGDVVTGELIERTPEHTVIEHPVFGRLEIPTERISAGSRHPGIAGTRILEGWDKNLNVGFSGSEGDTDEADVMTGLELRSTNERRQWDLGARYEVSYSDNDLDDHNARATAVRDQFFGGSRWLFFNYASYDFDEFESWKHRVTTGLGPGYKILPEGAFRLTARFGPFFTYEFGDEDLARPEAAAGLFSEWTVREGHTVRLSSVFLQTLNHPWYRDISRFEWKIRVTRAEGLSLKFGVENDYDSASDNSKNNLDYYSALSLDL
jgi:hypothetical protein